MCKSACLAAVLWGGMAVLTALPARAADLADNRGDVRVAAADASASSRRDEILEFSGREIQEMREWLLAYLVAHEDYRVEEIPSLRRRIEELTPAELEARVLVYRQKQERLRQWGEIQRTERRRKVASIQAYNQYQQSVIDRSTWAPAQASAYFGVDEINRRAQRNYQLNNKQPYYLRRYAMPSYRFYYGYYPFYGGPYGFF